jgi:hypothetical protein
VKTIDFDPGPGVDERSARGAHTVLLSYGAEGSYQGARTWNDPVQFRALSTRSDGTLFGVGAFDAATNFADRPPLDLRPNRGHGDGFLLALSPGAPPGTVGHCQEPAPVAAPVDHRLDGTRLPRTYEECLARVGGSFCDNNGDGICVFGVNQHADPDLYDECVRVGGGRTAGEGGEGDSCRVHYREHGGPCFGNLCD